MTAISALSALLPPKCGMTGFGFNYYHAWHERTYVGHAAERTSIPTQFWRWGGMKW
jgi:hypothetical protein